MKLLPFLIAVLFLLTACSQDQTETDNTANASKASTSASVVPSAAVIQAFAQAYPDASSTRWEREGDNYEVRFEQAGRNLEVLYSKDAKVILTEEEVSQDRLPKVVQQAIDQQYQGYRMIEIDHVLQKGASIYEVGLKKGDEIIEIIFSAEGEILNGKAGGDDDE
ncbi:MAG: PepSY-like domain-containing protein [Bacteroidia bacterium]